MICLRITFTDMHFLDRNYARTWTWCSFDDGSHKMTYFVVISLQLITVHDDSWINIPGFMLGNLFCFMGYWPIVFTIASYCECIRLATELDNMSGRLSLGVLSSSLFALTLSLSWYQVISYDISWFLHIRYRKFDS